MSDTQWPRYEVFQQARANQPLRNAGSVHAPDDELALLIARDVFVRRPDCHDLWVIRGDDILSRTAQELETTPPPGEHGSTQSITRQRVHVFQKRSQAGVETFVEYAGEVEADSSMHALANAIENWHDQTAYVWWIFPRVRLHAMIQTTPMPSLVRRAINHSVTDALSRAQPDA